VVQRVNLIAGGAGDGVVYSRLVILLLMPGDSCLFNLINLSILSSKCIVFLLRETNDSQSIRYNLHFLIH